MVETSYAAMTASRERQASTASGLMMLAIDALCLVVMIGGIVMLANDRLEGLPLLIVGVIGVVLISAGFYMLQPNQAAAILLFGSYRGTDRRDGLRWVLPWMIRKTIAVRANNIISDKLKVNDLRGNPIEIAAQLVWRVTDTAQALFDVDDYRSFVRVQIESGLRAIGSRYAYDDVTHGEVTLRNDHEQVNKELRAELIARLTVAGITVDECALTHLAYAPEIAGAMLRRQQAEAIVSARAKLVEGAVGMVQMALEQLSQRGVVELDDERRAMMVSNLMVVLCGDRDAQPIVNAGTLYQ
jgi:regulator of protease activity HflC (stomatin/prohibitin superfamily)